MEYNGVSHVSLVIGITHNIPFVLTVKYSFKNMFTIVFKSLYLKLLTVLHCYCIHTVEK